MSGSRALWAVVASAICVALAACGDDDEDEQPTPTSTPIATTQSPSRTATRSPALTTPSPTATPTATPAPTPSLAGTPQVRERRTITFDAGPGTVQLEVQVADESSERATGLMWVQSMPEDEGMLFVWPENTSAGFHMGNTYIPLTVAFVRDDGIIVHIEDMEPLTTDTHSSPENYRYAIEANQGWFGENAIEVGDRVVDVGL